MAPKSCIHFSAVLSIVLLIRIYMIKEISFSDRSKCDHNDNKTANKKAELDTYIFFYLV